MNNQIENLMVLNGVNYSKYVFILCEFAVDKQRKKVSSKGFFVGSGKSFIRLTLSGKDSILMDVEVENVHDVDSMGGTLFRRFVLKEHEALYSFVGLNQQKFRHNPALVIRSQQLASDLLGKKFEFVVKYPQLFYSFIIFQNEIIKSDKWSPDSLLYYYYQLFPDSIKKTEAGEEVVRKLVSKDAVRNFDTPVDFTAYDINGQRIKLRDLDGNFVLLNFWASWCAPCLDKIPSLKRIWAKYKPLGLRFISISQDTDSVAFSHAIQSNSMEWIHIYGNRNLIQYFGTYAIPKLYLLNANGIVIYNLENQVDTGLHILDEILAEQIIPDY